MFYLMERKKMMERKISKYQILEAQEGWGDAIVQIGISYTKKMNFQDLASEMIEKFYGYGQREVCFKPTRACELPFRKNKEEALSYFVGGGIEEDKGFALEPWNKVKFQNEKIFLQETMAQVMGHCFFTNSTGTKLKAECTLGYFLDEAGEIKIYLHQSSVPYSP